MNQSQVPHTENPENINHASSIINALSHPVLIIDEEGIVKAANTEFYSQFHFFKNDLLNKSLFSFKEALWSNPPLKEVISRLQASEESVKDFYLLLPSAEQVLVPVSISGKAIQAGGAGTKQYLLSFKIATETGTEVTYRKLLNEILSEAPAFICILRGPEHTFELANEKYLQLMGYRDIIGKKVKEALPEVENQGFISILDKVYQSGKSFVGEEIVLKLQEPHGAGHKIFLDFVYQPMHDASGEVNGIFVHAVDVTEKVYNRKRIEESEKELRNWIDTVPVIIWITNQDGEGYYLNKNWYSYTGQELDESLGAGWLRAVHPDDYRNTLKEFEAAHRQQKEFNVSYRLKTKAGDFRWVIDRGRPKYGPHGEFQGLIGSVIDVHEDKIKEHVIIEKEHRTRSLVEEATVATAVYNGQEMTIEFANDAMIELWGKDRSVLGKTLREALPELEGQPFHDLLANVFETGETYWGEEDRVDLMHNGKMETGYFNFTYKPLRDGQGKIYGILNMAIDVSDMVESRNLIKEREEHFRLLSNLMPEKVMNTNAKGEAIYFNKSWLDYSGLPENRLQYEWKELVHPDDRDQFKEIWQKALNSGAGMETEVRLKNRTGKYLWHLNRAEPVRDEQGQIKMWISTNTEIQRLKEEEKRKEDFLKMVSHELKTPVTSIKGYIQLLLSLLKPIEDSIPSNIPLRPSLERIDNQVVRLTRLISEMLDLTRLEDNQLELRKSVFSINELVDQTVQDIQLTNTQHQMSIFHKVRAEVEADRDRIGQVLINFITNAIKYSPESRNIEIHILDGGDDRVGVSVRDKGIGIDEKYHKNIFKRFYRVGGVNEETYSGFGIGLYLANEIIQRHNGSIEVNSGKDRGSDFCFKLSAVSIEK